MTNEQIEALKRQKPYTQSQNCTCEKCAAWEACIDFLASQNRLLADGCVGVKMDNTPEKGSIIIDYFQGKNTSTGDIAGYWIIHDAMLYKAPDWLASMIAAQNEKREGE